MVEAKVRELSVAEWRELARVGAALPVSITLDGDSMRPLIRRGLDRVTIVPLSRELLRGDVVLFEQPAGRYVVHRVRRLRGSQVQTLGDNCWNPDPWMDCSQVLGQAIAVERDGRRIALNTAPARTRGRVWMAARPVRCTWWRLKAKAGRGLRKLGLRK